MPAYDTVFRAGRVLTGAGIVPGCVGVRDGTIAAIEPLDRPQDGATIVDVPDDEVLIPGLVDTHVHVNEPGRTQWEGFSSATAAATAGGITTLLDMPLNSIPPTVDVAALEFKRDAATGQCFVDVGFWGGVVPGNLADLRGLHDAGVFGFKCFLVDSGVDEFGHLDADQFEAALVELRSLDALMIVHAEDSASIDRAPSPNGTAYQEFLRSRPRGAENVAVAQVIERARRTGARVHVLHLSSADALAMIASAKRDGVRITVETCPHYLALTAEEVPDGATQFKCCPPIREAGNRALLWQGLADGTIDCVVSDHSPCTVDLKRLDVGDFGLAWGGISSVQLSLPVVWTQARERGHTLQDVSRWMSAGPARLAGLAHKGLIAPGYDADLVAFAPDAGFVVDAATLHHKNPITPYAGRPLTGVVRSTWLRGRRVQVDGAGAEPFGRLLTRPPLPTREVPR